MKFHQTLFAIKIYMRDRGLLVIEPNSSSGPIPQALSHRPYPSDRFPRPTRHRSLLGIGFRAISAAHDAPFGLSVLSRKLSDHFLWRPKGLQSPNPIVHFGTRGQLAG